MKNNNVILLVVAPTRAVVQQAKKLGKFSSVNFKGWQQRVFFLLTTLGLQKLTSKESPVPAAEMSRQKNSRLLKYGDRRTSYVRVVL